MIEAANIHEQIQEKLLVFWLALAVGLPAIFFGWRMGLFRSFQASSLPAIRGVDVLKGFGYFLFMQILLVPALVAAAYAYLGAPIIENIIMRAWLNLFTVAGGFAACVLVFCEMPSSQRLLVWNQTEKPWIFQVVIGVAALLVIYPIIIAVNQLISIVILRYFHTPFIEQNVVQFIRSVKDQPLLFALNALAITIIVPITEEFLFRGLLQGWLKSKFHNVTIAIAITSIIFAFFHFSSMHGISNIELITTLVLLSCMLGYIYERQRSLWAPVGFHSLFNGLSLLLLANET